MDYDIELKMPYEIEQYERKIFDLKQLIEISKGLNSTLDYNILIESILLTCMGHMQLLKAGIFLKRSLDDHVYVLHRNYKGFELDHAEEYSIHTESPLVMFLEKKHRCYTLDDLRSCFPQSDELASLEKMAPSLIVPLQGKGKINGIIILDGRINNIPFAETEKEFLLNISSLAGIAIQNASLYEMATTDMMTKLKIHHFFQAVLVEERERSLKNRSPFSLIMMDIDHFKKFNDTYGHQCGDMVLKEVARILIGSVRQIDLAARYGGEEFALILPGSTLQDALVVAERIRKCIDEVVMHSGDRSLHVTISLGVTQFDPAGDTENRIIIERADRALYKAKSSGRNRVAFL